MRLEMIGHKMMCVTRLKFTMNVIGVGALIHNIVND